MEAPLRPLEYRLGDGCCWRIGLPWLLFRRDDDLLAEKLAKMLLGGLGEAGDCGMLWNAALGAAYSNSSGKSGDRGLRGLMGVLPLSFGFPRMANDSVEDLGIFADVCRGQVRGYYWPLSTALFVSDARLYPRARLANGAAG